MAKKALVWNTSPATLAAKITNVQHDIIEEVQYIIEEEIDLAANEMRNSIETRGTGYVSSKGRAPQALKESGRVEDGVMLSRVESGMVSPTAGRFGWGIRNQPVPEYFLEQEYDVTVGGNPPMHALTDAWLGAKTRYIARVKRLLTGRG